MKPIYISKFIYECTDNDKLTLLSDVDRVLASRWWVGRAIGSPRYGLPTLPPFNNWDMVIPEKYKGPKTFNSTNTFSDITNERALELEQLAESSEKPLGIMWSGGIDSTVIITACIRNFKSLNRLTVFMNNYSYYENPEFFYNVIKKYSLNVIEIGNHTFNERDKYIITDGVAVAPLFGPRLVLAYLRSYPLDKSFISSKDTIVGFLRQYIEPRFCDQYFDLNQYFDLVRNNINDVQAPVITVHDWFSWISFNFYWAGEFIDQYSNQICDKNTRNFSIFNKNTHNWYNTTEYQKWCFSEIGKQEKHFTNLSEYKMAAKKYIHSIDKDDNAMLYKTKCDSSYQYQLANRNKNIVIFDDGTGIDIDEPERLQKFVQDYYIV